MQCPLCFSKLKINKDYDRGRIREENRYCSNPCCDYEYHYFEGKRWEKGIDKGENINE